MKKIMMIAAALLMVVSVQAQDDVVKNTYVENGDVIEATIHFDTGEVSQTGYFTKDGKITGEWTSFDRNGNKTATAQYDKGQKVGTWFFWSSEKLTEVNYRDSRVAEVNTWKNEGTRVVSKR